MPLYRKKPVVIEAVQWDGQNYRDVYALYDPDGTKDALRGEWGSLFIPTLEGVMRADPGDWIIKGVEGEFYPCKPDIFKQTYDSLDNPTKAVVRIDPAESEALEIRFLEDPPEVVVLRHGMSFPEGGEAVYSELLDPDI